LRRAIIIVSGAVFVLIGVGSVIMLIPGGPYPAGLPFTIQQVQGGLVVQLLTFA
jgi:hypothetical protein